MTPWTPAAAAAGGRFALEPFGARPEVTIVGIMLCVLLLTRFTVLA